jgi:hypothetical protein
VDGKLICGGELICCAVWSLSLTVLPMEKTPGALLAVCMQVSYESPIGRKPIRQ